MPEMTIEDFCARAWKTFDLDNVNADYVEVLVSPTRDRLASEEDALASEPVNPLIFLTGIRSPQTSAHSLIFNAEIPSISLVVGTYGLGKTELMHQLCHHLLESQERHLCPRPLPVNLALCNPQVRLLEKAAPPTGEEFADLLFRHLVYDDNEWAFVKGPLLSAIAEGEVFLILDGLDELTVSPRQYLRFFDGLASLLALGAESSGAADDPLFRVVVSMRYELLAARDNDGSDLVRTLQENAPGGEGLAIYFLILDLFDNSRVRYYMDRRLPEHWFPRVSEHKALLEILYRPLLLRIFCDMASEAEETRMLAGLERYRNAAQLIDDYVERAASDRKLTSAQDNIGPSYKWNPDKLALECLDLYQRGINVMGTEDLRHVLQPDGTQASDEEVWRSIHKCPFLRRTGDHVVFTHRSFFEFFIAKGVSLDMEMQEERSERFSAFDKLVLNVDTRKFLKSLVVDRSSEEEWFRRTHRAYGLDDPEEWPGVSAGELKELDEERRRLLDAMTEPENKEVNERARGRVSTFLARNHDLLHPRYLTYNYEAVAVFIKSNRGEDLLQVRKDLMVRLKDRLDRTIAELESLTPEASALRNPMELLVERILSIALRLRYPWAPEYAGAQKRQRLEQALVGDEDTRDRIFAILEHIQRTIFVPVAS